ncbi:50S ribosomal protein L35ae [Candidatus Pacearchaeota archaeon]|nr:50S ribosomal protein L35ae [Candidatus Pacearchaeota archaeon]
MVKGIVVQFRRGRRTYKPRHFLIDINAKDKEEAAKSIGKEVVWTSPGKEKKKIHGKIASAHGNKGLVRAIFESGLPGQAITTEVEVK